MKLLADLHTHSNNSRFGHGKDSIDDMVLAANEIGLKEIAITDHAYKHLFHTSLEKIKKARKKIDEINKWSNTKVLLGIEADIISVDGALDIDDETLDYIDLLIVGYHRMVKTNFAGYFGGQKNSHEARVMATNAYLNALQKYPVSIISHIDSILDTDLYEIGCACRDQGVLIEINNRHLNWSEEKLNKLLSSGCMFVVSSDAHRRDEIGNVERAFKFIRENNIPSDCIANVEFNFDEKSELHKEVDIDYSFYEKTKGRIEEKRRQQEEKEKTEFTNKLSKEMSDALEEIARERNINIELQKKQKEDNKFEFFEKDLDEGDRVLNEARNYFKKMGIDIDKVIEEKQKKEQENVDEEEFVEEKNETSEKEDNSNKSISEMLLKSTMKEKNNLDNFEFVSEEKNDESQNFEEKQVEEHKQDNKIDFGEKLKNLTTENKTKESQEVESKDEQKNENNRTKNGFFGSMFDNLKK